MNNFGSRFKSIRTAKKVSQRALARRKIVSFAQIQRIENGSRDIYLKSANKLLRVFGFTLKIVRMEPDWNILNSFGLPLIIKNQIIIIRTGLFCFCQKEIMDEKENTLGNIPHIKRFVGNL